VREFARPFAGELPRRDVLRLVREVARVPPERFPRAELVRERDDVPVVRPLPVVFLEVVFRPVDVLLDRRELLPRVDALRVPAERDDVPREDVVVRRREVVLRLRERPDPAEERRVPELRPEDGRPLSFRRLALLSPRSRAWAVSRAISLLKLLCCPSAVVSWKRSARPLSSNFWNHSSQLISSSESAPL
jgi:hypothetical protein